MHCTLIQVNMNEKYLLGWLSILPFPLLPATVSAFKYEKGLRIKKKRMPKQKR